MLQLALESESTGAPDTTAITEERLSFNYFTGGGRADYETVSKVKSLFDS